MSTPPQDPHAALRLGLQLHASGQWEAALAALRQVLTHRPRDAGALAAAADCQKALGRPLDALALYQWALQAEPLHLHALAALGNLFTELRRPAEAARCYRGALRVRPDDPRLLANLGNALREAGELDEALSVSRRALGQDPGLVLALNTVGVILAAQGDAGAAAQSLRRSLEIEPRQPRILERLAVVLQQAGAARAGLELQRRVVELEPDRAEGWLQLGLALLAARRPEEAEPPLRMAIELAPDSLDARLGLTAALRSLGRAAEAEASAQAALTREPGSAATLAALGELCADRGDFDAARVRFDQALQRDPLCAAGWAGLAALRRMSAADVPWRTGAERALAKASTQDAARLRFALGKYCDDLGQYEEAFGHYRRANELARSLRPPYDRARFERRVARIVQRFDERFVQGAHPGADRSPRPVFILGMPRSGTTLAEQILASHPQVFGAGELRFWDEAFARLESGTGVQAGALGREYLERLCARAAPSARVTDKMPANFLYAGLIHAALPGARLIHMRRDPRDTALSIYFQDFQAVGAYANDLEDLAHYYGQYRRVMTHWRHLLPAGVMLEVPYEGLVTDAETWTRRMLEHIGLPWDARCLEFHRTERAVITASRWQVRQRINSASVGRWRHYAAHFGPLAALADDTAAIAGSA